MAADLRTRFLGFKTGVAAIVLAGALLSGCGNSGKSAQSPGNSAQVVGTNSTSACVAQATAIVKAGEADPAFPYTPIKGGVSSLRGKTAVVIGPTVGAGIIGGMAEGTRQGLESVGVQTRVVDAEGTNADNTAIDQAIAGHADLIVIMAVANDTVESALGAAANAHIPVVSVYEHPKSAAATAAVKGVVDLNADYVSNLMGAYILTKTSCTAETGMLYTPLFSAQVNLLNALKNTYAKLCPKTCSVDTEQYDPTKANTTAGSLLVNLAQRNPRLNSVVFAPDDPLATVGVPALKAAGKNIVGAGEGGSPGPLKMLADKTSMFSADVATSSQTMSGWIVADAGLRAMLGQPMGPSDALPSRLLTSETLAAGGDYFPSEDGFQAKFAAAWAGTN